MSLIATRGCSSSGKKKQLSQVRSNLRYSLRCHSKMLFKHQQKERRGKGPGRARGRQSRHKGTWMLKSSFMVLRVREWPLPTLFWADKDLPRKLLIAEWRTEFYVQFREKEKAGQHERGEECCRNRLQRQSEGCSGKPRGPAKAHPVRCMIPLCTSKRVSQAESHRRTSAIQD